MTLEVETKPNSKLKAMAENLRLQSMCTNFRFLIGWFIWGFYSYFSPPYAGLTAT